jgi:hypothetical protein
MDAWGHVLFAFSIGVGLSIYPIEKAKRLFAFLVIIMGVNFVIAYNEDPFYNIVGVALRTFVVGYLLFKRSLVDDPVEQAQLERLAILIFASTYISGASHVLDKILEEAGYDIVWKSMWRGHNLWHSPFMTIIFSFLASVMFYQIAVYIGSKGYPIFEPRSSLYALFIACTLGYFTHNFGDTITYDFDIFYFFPFHDYHFSGEDIVNHGLLTEPQTADKPEGTVYYWAIPFFAFLAAFFAAFKLILNVNDIREKFLQDNHISESI